jgi:hypothetical protein
LGSTTYPTAQTEGGSEWAEFTRRLMLPFYEEARRYLPAAAKDGLWNRGLAVYDPERLEAVIEQYEPRGV